MAKTYRKNFTNSKRKNKLSRKKSTKLKNNLKRVQYQEIDEYSDELYR